MIQAGPFGPGIPRNRLALHGFQLAAFNLSDQEDRRSLPDQQAAPPLDSISVRMTEALERADAFSHDPASLPAFAEGRFLSTTSEREGIVINRLLLKGGD